MMDELLDTEQACKLLKVSRRTLYNWRVTGRLPFVEFSKRMIRFRKSDLLNIILNNTITIEPNKEIERKADAILEKIFKR